MRKLGMAAAAALVAVAITGCGSDRDDDCTDVGRNVADVILEGANGSGLMLIADSGGAIQSENGVWWTAYRADLGDGGDEVEAAWMISEVAPPEGPIMSVDAYAAEWTDWPQMDGANASEMHQRVQTCIR